MTAVELHFILYTNQLFPATFYCNDSCTVAFCAFVLIYSQPRDCTNSQHWHCRDGGVNFTPRHITLRNDPDTNWVGFCVDARIGLPVLG